MPRIDRAEHRHCARRRLRGPVSGRLVLDAGTDFPATNAAGVSTLTLSDETPGTATNERLGAYLICETTPPTDATDIAAPFVVTVPFPDNQAGPHQQQRLVVQRPRLPEERTRAEDQQDC